MTRAIAMSMRSVISLAVYRKVSMKPRDDSTVAATSNCGTRTRRSAGHGRLHARRWRPPGRACRRAPPRCRRPPTPCAAAAGCRRPGRRGPTASAPPPYWMKARSGPLWSRTIDLVDHGQLEVRVRVVDGDARVLGQEHDEQRRADEQQRRAAVRPGDAAPAPRDVRRARAARRAGQRGQAQQQRRLGQRRELRPRGWRPCPRSSSRCPARRAR